MTTNALHDLDLARVLISNALTAAGYDLTSINSDRFSVRGIGHLYIDDRRGEVCIETLTGDRNSKVRCIQSLVARLDTLQARKAARAAARDRRAAEIAAEKPICVRGRHMTVDEARELMAEIEQQLDQLD